MRWVTDSDTGDTAMHVAAAVGNIKAFDATAQSFGGNGVATAGS